MLTDGIQSTESHSSAMTHPSALFPGDNHIKGNHRERHSTRRCMDAGRRERERDGDEKQNKDKMRAGEMPLRFDV